MRTKYIGLKIGALCTILLTSCGGSGSSPASSTPASSAPVTSTLSFPLQSGYKALIASGYSKIFTSSLGCSGTGTLATGAANMPATFNGTTGVSASQTLTTSYTNCTPPTSASTQTFYYDSNYNLLGTIGADFAIYLTPMAMPPTSVNVGSTGVLGTQTHYASQSAYLAYPLNIVGTDVARETQI
jgi:hypothetical protein